MTKKSSLPIALKIFVLVFAAGGLVYLLSLGYIASRLYRDNPKHSDAIVVLGSRVRVNTTYNPCLVYRVNRAVDLYKNHYADRIIFSGGGDTKFFENESEAMQKIASESGVPPQDSILEGRSISTYENLLYTKELLEKKQMHSIIIVSEPYHLPRAALIAKKLGIPYSVAPAFGSPCWERFKFVSPYFLREGAALLYYLVTGKISLL